MNIGIPNWTYDKPTFKKLLELAVFVHPSTRYGAILRLEGTVPLASPSVDMFIFCKVLDVD